MSHTIPPTGGLLEEINPITSSDRSELAPARRFFGSFVDLCETLSWVKKMEWLGVIKLVWVSEADEAADDSDDNTYAVADNDTYAAAYDRDDSNSAGNDDSVDNNLHGTRCRFMVPL